MRTLVVVGVFVGLTATASAQPRTVLSGIPSTRISEGGVERTPETLAPKDAVNLACVISEIDGKYYWASRENKELVLARQKPTCQRTDTAC